MCMQHDGEWMGLVLRLITGNTSDKIGLDTEKRTAL